MPVLLFLFFALLLNSSGAGPFGQNLIQPRGPADLVNRACIDPSAIGTTPILFDIPKPDNINSPFPTDPYGPIHCPNGSCTGPDSANYVMANENVKIEAIWPDDRTTRLAKQKLPNETRFDSIKDRVYRASCNDFCYLGLPYGGTFHCDFIFLLHQNEELVDREVKPGVKELYPKDGAMFDILIRQGAPIPEYAGQPGKRRPVRCDLLSPQSGETLPMAKSWPNLIREIAAQDSCSPQVNFIDFTDPADQTKTARFIFNDDFDLPKLKLREETAGRKLLGTAKFRCHTYEVFLNLPTVEPISNDYIYLVEPGKVTEAQASSDPFFTITYLEFRRSPEVRPKGKTLQLGTFSVPVSKGWWTLFANESKPAIYFYPEKDTVLSVKLNPAGQLTISDPLYDEKEGWKDFIAHPDGTLTYRGQTYPYLYYEANLEKVYVAPQGFIVEGKTLVSFFQEVLPKLGLNGKETADFIDYWMGRLNQSQPYYFINFLDNNQIEVLEPLAISQRPTTIIRLRAYFKPLEESIDVAPQILPVPPKRKGFTLVEWGGILDE